MREVETLPQIVDLDNDEIAALLKRTHQGHLGLSREDHPYVVPITFAYDAPHVYFFTTEGQKTEFIDVNPLVCLQVEEVRDPHNWKSVILNGKAGRLTDNESVERAMRLIRAINPRLAPAWSIRWMDDSIRSNVAVVYRIEVDSSSGRATLPAEKR